MENNKKIYSLGVAALFISAFCFASAYLFVKQIVDTFSPYYLLAFRFMTAAVMMLLIFAKRLKKVNRGLLISGGLMGTAMFFVFLTFTVGLKYTTASRSSFIVAAYIIVLPFAYMVIRRRMPKKQEFLAAAVCMAGIALILAGGSGSLNKGDIITCFCAVSYAVHIVLTGKFAKEQDDGILLNVIQITTVAILATAVALCVEPFPKAVTGAQAGSILYLAVMSTIIPNFLNIFGQKHVKTTTSGIILSFESVFATLMAICFLGDKINIQFFIGGVLVIGAFFVSENKKLQNTT